ncbi:MAG: hypothetical protein AAF092_09955 [Pseudomonadota bacterium]
MADLRNLRALLRHAATAALAILLAVPLHAQDRAEEAYNACSNATALESQSIEALAQLGWMERQTASAEIRDHFTDGFLAAMTTTRDKPIVWDNAFQSSINAAGTILSGATNGFGRLFTVGDPIESILVVVPPQNVNPNWTMSRCIYSGPFGESISSFLNSTRAMDERAGVEQASAGLDIFTLRTQQQDAETGRTIVLDAQFGVFTDDVAEVMGRKPKVPGGMSFNRLTQR